MECLSSRREREAPGGGRAKIENSSRRHPRKFGQKRFLAVRRSWRGNGVACFWATSLKKISGGCPSPRHGMRSSPAGRFLQHDTLRDLCPTRRSGQGKGGRCRRDCKLPRPRHATTPSGYDALTLARPPREAKLM